MASEPIELLCPAKVNLALSVGARDETGLHPIASWMVAVQFGDVLTLEPAQNDDSRFDIERAGDAPSAWNREWSVAQDLCFRTHQLVEQQVHDDLPVRLKVRKRIPPGAGLGGGSANAAATLMAMRRLFGLAWDRNALVRLSRQIGSDVGFLVHALSGGTSSALVTGYGDAIEPIELTQPLHMVLILPPYECHTGTVYGQFDVIRANRNLPADVAKVKGMARGFELSPHELCNDLAESACHVEPRLAQDRERLRHVLGQDIHITGSGSAMFTITPDAKTARQLAQQVKSSTGLPAVPTCTMPSRH